MADCRHSSLRLPVYASVVDVLIAVLLGPEHDLDGSGEEMGVHRKLDCCYFAVAPLSR